MLSKEKLEALSIGYRKRLHELKSEYNVMSQIDMMGSYGNKKYAEIKKVEGKIELLNELITGEDGV